MTDPHAMLAGEIAALLRGDGDPAIRYHQARAAAEMMTVAAAKAVADSVAQAGSVTGAAEALEISPQAVSQLLAKHGYTSPRKPGRPKKENTDATRTRA